MRGEEYIPLSCLCARMELPPLARGRGSWWCIATYRYGITPACAGKSDRAVNHFPGHRNYPRLRGEEPSCKPSNKITAELPPLARGRECPRWTTAPLPELPPLARGTELMPWQQQVANGITPACAGNRDNIRYQAGLDGNYPRLRGEQAKSCRLPISIRELPPLARGTGALTVVFHRVLGITPACAGNRA